VCRVRRGLISTWYWEVEEPLAEQSNGLIPDDHESCKRRIIVNQQYMASKKLPVKDEQCANQLAKTIY
jgi:hypothetical protein